MDSLAPELVEPLLAGRFGRPYVFREACESTQLLLDPGQPEGAVAVCEEQTCGRGRLGQRWNAPARTSILCSTLLLPPPGRRAAELSLLGGLAAAGAVEAAVGSLVRIKWPNDVIVGERKVAGLAEAHEGAVVLGLGVNVNQVAEQLPPEATSLRMLDGSVRGVRPLLADLLRVLEDRYERWRVDGLASLHAELARRDFLRGRSIVVDGVSGSAKGIDEAGRLLLDTGTETLAVESGRVTWV